jgi:acyl-CoA thioesterase FadM
LRRPTPKDCELVITSQVKELKDDRAEIELLLEANGKVCATGSGLFVAVKEGHPAYHRWN